MVVIVIEELRSLFCVWKTEFHADKHWKMPCEIVPDKNCVSRFKSVRINYFEDLQTDQGILNNVHWAHKAWFKGSTVIFGLFKGVPTNQQKQKQNQLPRLTSKVVKCEKRHKEESKDNLFKFETFIYFACKLFTHKNTHPSFAIIIFNKAFKECSTLQWAKLVYKKSVHS